MKKYKIVFRGIFIDIFYKEFKRKKHYFQRTKYYKANSKKEALAKLEEFSGVVNGKECANAWVWKVISVEATK